MSRTALVPVRDTYFLKIAELLSDNKHHANWKQGSFKASRRATKQNSEVWAGPKRQNFVENDEIFKEQNRVYGLGRKFFVFKTWISQQWLIRDLTPLLLNFRSKKKEEEKLITLRVEK